MLSYRIWWEILRLSTTKKLWVMMVRFILWLIEIMIMMKKTKKKTIEMETMEMSKIWTMQSLYI